MSIIHCISSGAGGPARCELQPPRESPDSVKINFVIILSLGGWGTRVKIKLLY